MGRLHRRLGALHDTGFPHFNHSPLKSVFFDDVGTEKYLSRVDPRTLERTLQGLVRERERFVAHEDRFDTRPIDKKELRFALDASILAAEKGLGRKPRTRVAREQSKLLERHHELWLARNRPSNFEATRALYRRAIDGVNGK